MRSVKAERKPRGKAPKRPGRRGAATVRPTSDRPGKRTKARNDGTSGFFGEVKRRLTFRHPILALTLALMAITGVAALP